MNIYEVTLDNGNTRAVMAKTVGDACEIVESYWHSSSATDVKLLHENVLTRMCD